MISQLSTSSRIPPIDHNTKGCPHYRWLQGSLHLTTRYRVSPTSQTIKDLDMFFLWVQMFAFSYRCCPIYHCRHLMYDNLIRCDRNYSFILTSSLTFFKSHNWAAPIPLRWISHEEPREKGLWSIYPTTTSSDEWTQIEAIDRFSC